MQYIIMARVSGGCTGTREAPLKDKGAVLIFDSKEAAEKRMPPQETLTTGARLQYFVVPASDYGVAP